MTAILITGNDNSGRIQQMAALSRCGFPVIEAPTFAEARVQLQFNTDVSCVVINVISAVENARRLIAFVRDELARPDLRIIVIGANDDGTRSQLQPAVDRYLTRPIDVTTIITMMSEIAA